MKWPGLLKASVIIALVIIVLIIIGLLIANNSTKEVAMPPNTKNDFNLSSPAFTNNGNIPVKYTCRGEDISPPLAIHNAPANTETFALIVHDPDAPNGDFLHWAMWDIPGELRIINENSVPNEAAQGTNGFGKTGYGGPCPPSGVHHYEFDLYALDNLTKLPSGASRQDLKSAISGHVIARTTLTGLFSADK